LASPLQYLTIRALLGKKIQNGLIPGVKGEKRYEQSPRIKKGVHYSTLF
jgi:hypothetical protein